MSMILNNDPSITDAGLDFNYGSWTEDTQLTMVNVPWGSDYRDIVRFTSQSLLDAWIDRKPNVKLANMSMQQFEHDVYIDTPINSAMKYNYLRAKNGFSAVGDDARNYYYFIMGYDYIAPDNTRLRLQLDVWQTFGYEVTFGQCYVERGHIGIANTNSFDNYGRDYLTVPEGLDIGSEYQIVHTEQEMLMQTNADTNSPLAFDVLVCSTQDLTKPAQDASGKPQIFSATGSTFEGLPSGANFYIFKTPEMFSAWLAVNSAYPWLTSSIMGIWCIPSMSRYVPGYNYGTNLGDQFIQWYAIGGADSPQPHVVQKLPDWRNADFVGSILGPDYSILKKFLTSPYMILELTTWTSSPIVIKPEMWQDKDATVREMAAFVPPGQRIAIMPANYNKGTNNPDPAGDNDGGEFLNVATVLDNFPTLPIINNGAILYMAQNRNGINFQYTSADWSQQRAMMGAQAGADVAGSQIRNISQQSGIQTSLATANANSQMSAQAQNGILSAWGQVASIDPLGAVHGGLSAATLSNTLNSQYEQLNNSNAARGNSAVADIQNQGRIRDTNLDFAQTAARGDYNNQVSGVNAKVQDIRMTQPSVSGQFGGDSFNIVNNVFGWALNWKMVNKSALRQIGNYWLRYGYAVQQFTTMPTDFMCMSKFTYWKLLESYISQGAFPELFKNTIRGIFEKGVTVWRNPDDIGTGITGNVPAGSYTL